MQCEKCQGEMTQLPTLKMSRKVEFACIECGYVLTKTMSAIHPDCEVSQRTTRKLTSDDNLYIFLGCIS